MILSPLFISKQAKEQHLREIADAEKQHTPLWIVLLFFLQNLRLKTSIFKWLLSVDFLSYRGVQGSGSPP